MPGVRESRRPADPGGGVKRLTGRVLGSIWTRILVTLGLLAVVAANVDWSLMRDRVSAGEPGWVLIAVMLVVAALAVGLVRWWHLLTVAGVRLDTRRVSRVYAVSTFSSTFLPTSVGGDVARALLVVRRGPLLARVAMSVVVDRIGGLIGLLGVAWIALLADPQAAPYDVRVFFAWVTAVFGIGGLLGLAVVLRARALSRFVPRRLQATLARARQVLLDYTADPRLVLSLVFTSLVFQALVALSVVALARAIDIELTFATAAVTITLMTVATLVPLSIAGFGVREASYVVVLGESGVSATDATLISLLTVVTLLIASLPGAYLLARHGTTPALETAT
ncbi:lysylphosphatidylglycerol synthase transmembrane domain-containing protein [Paraconexibacter algicola]|nr:lysylphosphatidylglycerol synthase transmembrane domain-containing protein [Paraconexibacter algicola]